MNRSRRLTLALLTVLLLTPLAATADSHETGPKPVTWLSYVMSKPGQGGPLAQHIAEEGKKIYDGLVADGHVITWGVALPINHRADDGWNVVEWVTFRDWAAMDTFMQGFMGMQMAKSPEQRKSEQEKWYSLVEANTHFDEILRHRVVVPAEGMKPGYFDLSYWRVKPGQMGDLEKLWTKERHGMLKGLQDEKKIGAFGMAASEVHDGSGNHAVFWIALPGLGALEAVDAAATAASEARSDEDRDAMMKKFGDMIAGGHHDRILMVVHYGGPGAEGGGGEGAEGGGGEGGG